jgi:hypothetical protein
MRSGRIGRPQAVAPWRGHDPVQVACGSRRATASTVDQRGNP